MPKRRKIWASALCWGCEHHHPNEPGTCEAFPEGIPHAIVSNEIDHFVVLEGQLNDLVYEPKKKKEK